MKVSFWGVRGSIPTPIPGNLGFGGNTSCLELSAPGSEVVILDSGTGIRALGQELIERAQGNPLRIHLFLTHFHWDHIQALPYFRPLYDSANSLTVYSAGHCAPLREALAGLMSAPYYPVPFGALPARLQLVRLDSSSVKVGPLELNQFPVHHPQEACGYRVASGGAVLVYVPDHEHGNETADRVIREQARDADALIYDSQYTPKEYEMHRGWGHSTWAEAVRAAKDAGVKRLVLFHHDPAHSDEMVASIEVQARTQFPNTWAAKEGWSIEL